MKQSQMLLALVAMSVMVFVITFLMNYSPATNGPVALPGAVSPSKAKSTEADAWVRLYETSYPAIPLGVETQQAPPVEVEHGKPGYHDFWFINETNEAIRTGLISVSCSCSRMEAFVMPPQWKERWLKLRPNERAIPSSGSDKELLELENNSTLVDLKTDSKEETGATVPPGAIGKFRMHWNGQKTGVQRITAKLWGGHPRNVAGELSIFMVLLDPLRMSAMDHEVKLGVLSRNQLPYSGSIYIWSSTRDSLPLEARLGNREGALGADPVQVAKPVPLSAEACKELEQLHMREVTREPRREDLMGHVRSAVRVDFKVQTTGRDGKTLIEIGTFRRSIKIGGDDTGAELSVIVEGALRGDVECDEVGQIKFDSVLRSKGDSKTVTLRSDFAGMDLEIDRTRLPAFLAAELSKPDVKKEGAAERGRTWRLKIEILPNRGTGVFPREEPASYWDCAVYLRLIKPGVAADAPREYLRVPVTGVIQDG